MTVSELRPERCRAEGSTAAARGLPWEGKGRGDGRDDLLWGGARVGWRYFAAVLVTCVAFLSRLALGRYVEAPFLLFAAAELFVAVACGFGPGVVAASIAAAFAYKGLLPRAPLSSPQGLQNLVMVAVFGGICVVGCAIAEHYRRAIRKYTERARALAVKEGEERFRLFFDNPAIGVLELDLEGRFRAVNDRYCQLTGWARNDLVGRSLLDVCVPRDRARYAESWRRFQAGEAPRFEEERRHLRKEGGEVWLHVNAGFIYDAAGGLLGAGAIVEDISERKRAEQTIRDSRAQLQYVFDNLTEAVVVFNPDGSLLLWNRVAEAMHRTRDEDRGRNAGHFETLFTLSSLEGVALPREQWPHRRILRGERLHDVEVRARCHHTGEEGVVSCSGGLLRDERGEPLMAIYTISDVSERKQAEEALRRALAAAEDADRRKSEFLAVLSHELRNPLAPICNSLYLLDCAAPGSEQAGRAKEIIRRQVQHLSRLVDDLLDVTRIARGKSALQRQRLDLCEVVRRTCEDHRSLFGQKALELAIALPEAPVWIDGDATRLAQVIGNLLQNAVKFTPPRGKVAVAVEESSGGAVFQVRDDGIGMDEALVGRVFEPFVQADRNLARSQGGLGLGLALVKGIIDLHGGGVSARSDGPGRGAEFTVTLPLATAVPGEAVAPSPAAQGARSVDVLVIEDNADAAATLVEVLELAGHRVRVAHAGWEGVSLARQSTPEVVLCDIGLPDIDGYEVARILSSEAVFRTTRLIALSGYAQPEDLQRAKDAGFELHLAKPPRLSVLIDLVAQRLPSRQAEPS